MPEPIKFTSHTHRFALPLLFAGQAQKEFFYNESTSLIDSLLHIAVEDISTTPPASPTNGQIWLIGSGAEGDWSGKDNHLAVYTSDQWTLIAPRDGMQIFDRTKGQTHLYDNGWQSAVEPTAPRGGATVDAKARTAINELIDALKQLGILARN